jgi:hypothetical protein
MDNQIKKPFATWTEDVLHMIILLCLVLFFLTGCEDTATRTEASAVNEAQTWRRVERVNEDGSTAARQSCDTDPSIAQPDVGAFAGTDWFIGADLSISTQIPVIDEHIQCHFVGTVGQDFRMECSHGYAFWLSFNSETEMIMKYNPYCFFKYRLEVPNEGI